MRDLLQALDTDSRLDLLPSIWKGEFQDALFSAYLDKEWTMHWLFKKPLPLHVRICHIDLFFVLFFFSSDIKTLGHDNKPDLVEELLGLMAREKHSSEVSLTTFVLSVFAIWTVMSSELVMPTWVCFYELACLLPAGSGVLCSMCSGCKECIWFEAQYGVERRLPLTHHHTAAAS